MTSTKVNFTSIGQTPSIPIRPVISYPREAQVGKTYLMTIDLEHEIEEWPFEEEEYPIYCIVDAKPLFKSQNYGEPVVVLHRFGGSFGSAQFLLTADQYKRVGKITISFINASGLPVRAPLALSPIQITEEEPDSLEVTGIELSNEISESLIHDDVNQSIIGDRNQTIGQVLGGMVVYTSSGQAIVNTSREFAEQSASPTLGANPYKGLMAFQETDGDRFFGRETQIQQLWEKFCSLHEQVNAIRVLPIYGSSGSGKSSLVRAGLIPELARHPVSGYEYGLDLMSISIGKTLPISGKRLIAIARNDQNALHFCIFDRQGEKVVDLAEANLEADKSTQLETLKTLLQPYWNRDESSIPPQDKKRIIDTVTSVTGHTTPRYNRARVVVLVPGTHPLESLASVLARIVTQDLTPIVKSREFVEELKQVGRDGEYNGLRRIADVMPDIAIAPLIVLVDQFEEIYALCENTAERDAFIGNLLHAAGDRAKRVTVIVTLRSDFLGETQKHPVLNRLFSEQGHLVSIMTLEGLRQAIAKPAEQAGYPLDSATIDLLVKDTQGREGALPLLQFALTRIWEGLAEGRQPAETLRAIGGVGGALAGEAQRIYDSLDDDEKVIARRLFLGLVQLGEGTKDNRRRASLDSLISYKDQPAKVERVIGLFASPGVRLITLSISNGNTETVEITHEALFDHWYQFQNWLEESRYDIRFQRRLDEAARHWYEQGRPEGSVWRPPDLDMLKQYRDRLGDNMTPLQMEFYDASIRADRRFKPWRWFGNR